MFQLIFTERTKPKYKHIHYSAKTKQKHTMLWQKDNKTVKGSKKLASQHSYKKK